MQNNDMFKRALPTIAVLVLCGALITAIAMWLGPDSPNEAQVDVSEKTTETLPAPLTADQLTAYDVEMTNNDNPVAVLTTSMGVVEIELFEDTMPITAGNFKKLVSEGFYDGTKFHRVIEGFMIQGGDPISKTDEVMRYGTGNPGYSIQDEHIKGEYLSNVRGTISMANSGPNSGGSQFFINLVDNVNLDFDKEPLTSKHPVFGRVLSGMEVIDAIAQVETNPRDVPLEPIIVEKVEVREK
ncbi:MAG: peptidylprolyl isomerase [Patescibacteria group bacterium]